MGNNLTKDPVIGQLVKLATTFAAEAIKHNFFGKKQQKQKTQQKQPTQKIVIKQDPELLSRVQKLQKLLKQSQQQLDKVRQQAQILANPDLFKQKKEQIFVAFLDNLKKYKFTQKIKKQGKRYHILIGTISCGKSSILNSFLNLKLPTGVGQTTLSPTQVASNGKVSIIDSPGANDDFNFYDVKTLGLFQSVDRVFLLYRSSLKDVKDIMRILKVIKPDDTYLIRTQCDLFGDNDNKTLEDELDVDRDYVRQHIGHQFRVFATSAKYDLDFADNRIVSDLIKGIQQ